MSDEQFNRIEHELTDVRARFDRMDARFDDVDARFAAVDVRFAAVDVRFGAIDTRFAGIDARFDRVEARLDGLDARMEELRRHMHVLHEDMITSFAAASERSVVTRDEFHEAFVDLKESIGRRLDPIEMTVRAHSADIAKLKRARR